MVVRLTSGMIKYYRGTGPYYNFKTDDGMFGGQFLHRGSLWGHVTPEVEADLDMANIIPYVTADQDAASGDEARHEGAGQDVGQYDGGLTPDSLSLEEDVLEPGCMSGYRVVQ